MIPNSSVSLKGQIVKTLYVAALKDSCHFIGFIKSGGIASEGSVVRFRSIRW